MTILVILLVIAFFIGAIFLGLYFEKKRREAMTQIAEQLGLTYYGNINIAYDLKLFNTGDSRKSSHCVTGNKDGLGIELFDYKYSTGSGKNRHTHYFSVCVLTLAQYYKNLYIRSESFFDKIAGAIGFDDIDFESKEFSSKFYVQSSDKKFAYDIIHPQMMAFLLDCAKCPTIEMRGRQLCFYYTGKIAPEKFVELFKIGQQFVRKIPNYVLEEYAVKPKGIL